MTKNLLDDDSPANQDRRLQADKCYHRNQRVAQRVPDDDEPLGKTFRQAVRI